MQTEHYKGIVKNRTLSKILGDKDTIRVQFKSDGKIEYNTVKSGFVAERKNAKYWTVFQVLGMAEVA